MTSSSEEFLLLADQYGMPHDDFYKAHSLIVDMDKAISDSEKTRLLKEHHRLLSGWYIQDSLRPFMSPMEKALAAHHMREFNEMEDDVDKHFTIPEDLQNQPDLESFMKIVEQK